MSRNTKTHNSNIRDLKLVGLYRGETEKRNATVSLPLRELRFKVSSAEEAENFVLMFHPETKYRSANIDGSKIFYFSDPLSSDDDE